MVQAYNFLASWQLFPEKCVFDNGVAPKSGNYKIESIENGQALSISINWVSLDNEAFYTQYRIVPNEELIALESNEIANQVQANISKHQQTLNFNHLNLQTRTTRQLNKQRETGGNIGTVFNFNRAISA